jgi:hypothetical protein
MTKYVHTKEFVASFARIEGGHDGCWEDNRYERYGGT